jgi:hypothetical protein
MKNLYIFMFLFYFIQFIDPWVILLFNNIKEFIMLKHQQDVEMANYFYVLSITPILWLLFLTLN